MNGIGALHVATIVNAFGGSGISGAEHSLALARRGHRVTMITYAPNELPHLTHPNLEVRAVEPAFWGGTPYPDVAVCFASAVKQIADEIPLDLIHAHYAVPHGQSALLGRGAILENRAAHRTPAVVITCRGTDVTLFSQDSRAAPALGYVLRQADELTFVSEGLRSAAHRHFRMLPEGHVIPNFVPLLASPPAPSHHKHEGMSQNSVVFFHVSLFRPLKNVCWIIRAFAAAREQRAASSPDIELLLVGDGPTRQPAEVIAKELRISDRVTFLGAVPHRDVQKIISDADVLLMASDSEGCPRAVLEAMVQAKPTVATDVDGLNEIIKNGETGRLCRLGDIEAYAAAIVEFADHASWRARLGAAAKVRAEHRYGCDAVMAAYEDVYARAIARANQPHVRTSS